MATFQVTIPDQHLTEVVETLSDLAGWRQGNGETRAQAARRGLSDLIREEVRKRRIVQADTLRTQIEAQVKTDLAGIG